MDIVVIGGGAAGFFAALAAKKANPAAKVLLLEKSAVLLAKVRISGGGRCNVTHQCFDPLLLVKNYPRGSKELIGPFTRFQPRDTIEWFEKRGVSLKTEEDGRIFPVSDSSETIIDCLLREAGRLGVTIQTKQRLEKIQKNEDAFCLHFADGSLLNCKMLLLASGSSPQGHAWVRALGHTIKDPVPSLFTFNIPSFPLADCAGISVEKTAVHIKGSPFTQSGPLLITHWGFSGPAALKLSAWGARHLHAAQYKVELCIDWLPDLPKDKVLHLLQTMRNENSKQNIGSYGAFGLPKNLWRQLLERAGLDPKRRFSDLGKEAVHTLSALLKSDSYLADGKTTHKEEFVTCGGVDLSEVDFRTMQSKLCPGLYFAGEILDVDAVTGGFNFQNAWTTGWIAGNAMSINMNPLN